MRLINARTLSLEDFTLKPKPKYAILSHTWEVDEEVSYQEMLNKSNLHKKGWTKIQKTCGLAVQSGLEFAWIDTCCIDKSSSAELTEAINSMFAWYHKAEECYAMLSDIPPHKHSEIMKSRWWSRGWTLQELIAPRHLSFYDSAWCFAGSRERYCDQITQHTRIPESVLRQELSLDNFPIAVRMSWASKRSTTREEDEAYCLLGIFDVSMPLIYGEGRKAFLRLQEEIAKRTNDLTILASTADEPRYGMLATSPRGFESCSQVFRLIAFDRLPVEFSITNRGLSFSSASNLYILAHTPGSTSTTQIYALRLCRSHNEVEGAIYLCLRKLGPSLYHRHPDFPSAIFREGFAFEATIYESSLSIVNDNDITLRRDQLKLTSTVRILESNAFEVEEIAPQMLWDAERRWLRDEQGHFAPDHFPRVSLVLALVKVAQDAKHVLVYWPAVNGSTTPEVYIIPVESELDHVRKFFRFRRPKPILMDDFTKCFDTTNNKPRLAIRLGDRAVTICAVIKLAGFNLHELTVTVDQSQS